MSCSMMAALSLASRNAARYRARDALYCLTHWGVTVCLSRRSAVKAATLTAAAPTAAIEMTSRAFVGSRTVSLACTRSRGRPELLSGA